KKDYQPTVSHSSKKFSSDFRRVPYVPKNSINRNSSGSVKTPTTRYFYSLAFMITLISMITLNINPRESIDIAFHHLVPSRIPETSAHQTEEPFKNFNNALRDFRTATNIFDSISELEQQSLPMNWPNIEDHFQCTKLKNFTYSPDDVRNQPSTIKYEENSWPVKKALQMFVEGYLLISSRVKPMGPKFAKGLQKIYFLQNEHLWMTKFLCSTSLECGTKQPMCLDIDLLSVVSLPHCEGQMFDWEEDDRLQSSLLRYK
ncbi:hypothetical protein PSHT_03757, partial [Puccinia striiformis]